MHLRTTGWLCAIALGLWFPGPAAAQEDHSAHNAPKAAPATTSGVQLRLDDTSLQDQDGREVRLKSDVLGPHVTVVNFIYTTCTTVCPVSSATMALLQQRLGARLGDQVQLVSITVDPLRDTPARLKAYSARHDAGSHWLWLTGRKSNVDVVLKAFGAYTPNPEDHPAMTMIGDAGGRHWIRLYGFPSVDELLAQIELVRSAPIATHQH